MKRSRRNVPDGPAMPRGGTTPAEPSPDAVACRAYELYLARGCADGCDFDDWLQAEQELRTGTIGQMNAD